MKKIILTPEKKMLEVDPGTDPCIIRMPRPASRTGTDYAQGEDLYRRTTPDGDHHYYIISWTLCQRDFRESYRTVQSKEAEQFILDQVKKAGKIGLDPDVVDQIEKFFPGLLSRRR